MRRIGGVIVIGLMATHTGIGRGYIIVIMAKVTIRDIGMCPCERVIVAVNGKRRR